MVGSFLLSVAFALPFFVDAGSFAVAAGLVFLIAGQFRAPRTEAAEQRSWRHELAEGVRWLRGHELLWPMAIILGLMNAMGMMLYATLVLYSQEVLGASATTFALMGTGVAIGGIVGSLAAPRVSQILGAGPSLALTMVGGALSSLALALTSSWQVVWVAFAIEAGLGSMWNVITVSLRQAIIPDQLLGRVNSVYRFLAWGMMPIGSLVGGLIVAVADGFGSRELALRLPYIVALVGNLALLAFASRRLTTAKIDAGPRRRKGRRSTQPARDRERDYPVGSGWPRPVLETVLHRPQGLPVSAQRQHRLLGPGAGIVHRVLRPGGVQARRRSWAGSAAASLAQFVMPAACRTSSMSGPMPSTILRSSRTTGFPSCSWACSMPGISPTGVQPSWSSRMSSAAPARCSASLRSSVAAASRVSRSATCWRSAAVSDGPAAAAAPAAAVACSRAMVSVSRARMANSSCT